MIYFESINHIVSSIQLRFHQPSFKACEQLESLLLMASESKNIDESLDFVKRNCSGDTEIPALCSQIPSLPVIFRESPRDITCFEDFFEKLKERPTDEHHLIFEVVTIGKLLHVNPATSASGEQSFSMARSLITWLRSNMTQERLNALAILHAHKERTDTLLLAIYMFAMKTDTNFGRVVKDGEF